MERKRWFLMSIQEGARQEGEDRIRKHEVHGYKHVSQPWREAAEMGMLKLSDRSRWRKSPTAAPQTQRLLTSGLKVWHSLPSSWGGEREGEAALCGFVRNTGGRRW